MKQDEIRGKKLRELQLAELDLLKLFVEICEKEQLHYCVIGGTLLGAVRHKGMIPWDDDIDVAMPRPDFEKLISVMERYLPEEVSFVKHHNRDYIARMYNERVPVIWNLSEYPENIYAWLDIFPLDGLPTNPVIRNGYFWYLMALRALFKLSVLDRIGVNLTHRVWYERVFIFIGRRLRLQKYLSTEKRLAALDKALKRYSYYSSAYIMNFMGVYKAKEIFEKDIYDRVILHDFEGFRLYGLYYYDTYLTRLYGENYMSPPPMSERNRHATTFDI